MIKKYRNIDLDIDTIDLTNKEIYDFLTEGNTTKVFQFESSLFKDFTPKAKPSSILDLSAITSLLRPAAMGSGLHEQYLRAKNEGALYDYDIKDKKLLSKLWEICSDCYSIMAYQEHVLLCFMQIAGWDDVRSEAGRRNVAKKKLDAIAAMREEFIVGGIKNGYERESLNTLFNKIEQYSAYGFAKPHACAYSLLSFQTAYLSCYYPLEYFCAALTIDAGNEQDVISYIRALKLRNLQVLSPDINNSEVALLFVMEVLCLDLALSRELVLLFLRRLLRINLRRVIHLLDSLLLRTKKS